MCGCGNGNKDPNGGQSFMGAPEVEAAKAGFSPWLIVVLIIATIGMLFNDYQKS